MSVNSGDNAPSGRVNFDWIGESFELYRVNIRVWIVAALLIFVPCLIRIIVNAFVYAGAVQHQPGDQVSFGSILFSFGSHPFSILQSQLPGGLPTGLYLFVLVTSNLYLAWLFGGSYSTAVKQVRGEVISIRDIFSGGPLIWKMVGFNVVYGFAFFLGFLFCLVPGFLLAGLLFPAYALIADGETVGNALSRSIYAMKNDIWNAGAFVCVMGLLVFVSVIFVSLGLLVSMPMFYLGAALAYRDMIGMPGAVSTTGALGAPGGYRSAQSGVWPPPPG
jgi:hypothetical protein